MRTGVFYGAPTVRAEDRGMVAVKVWSGHFGLCGAVKDDINSMSSVEFILMWK